MKKITKNCFRSTLLLVALFTSIQFVSAAVSITGDGPNGTDMMLFHKIVLTVDGPAGAENKATFQDNRMTVDFVNGGTTVTVSGYFAADGDAANTSATSGNKWRCNFRPEKTGTWTYKINFRTGTDIALKLNTDVSGSTAIAPDGTTGSFNIVASNKTGKDFRNPQRGPLKNINKHYYKYAGSDNYFVRGGIGVPEALFSYSDFDNTPAAKPFTAHASHYNLNPSPELLWAGDKGKNLMGAANYNIQQGGNTLYGVMFNIDGDGTDSRFPWITATDCESFDVSKLEQWDRVLTHFNNVGVAFIFMFAETENETSLTNSQLKLWYREAAARFGHNAAISFVLCEEMKQTLAPSVLTLMDFLIDVDGHKSPVGAHTPAGPNAYKKYYQPMADAKSGNYACIQTKETNYADIYSTTKLVRDWSVGSGKTPLVVCTDEARDAGQVLPKVDSQDPNHDTDRINAIWGNLMAGGMGLSFYTTANGGDINTVSFVEWKGLLNQCGAAVNFFWDNNIPLGDMAPTDALVTGATGSHCLSAKGRAYVIHLPEGGNASLNLAGVTGKLKVSWLDTKTGEMKNGSVTEVTGGGVVSLGNAPAGLPTDKVIYVGNGGGEKFTLTTSVQNGTIDPSVGSYPAGTVVPLTAKGNLGYKFSAWGGDASGSENSTSVTMNANKNVTATFVTTPTYTLNVTAVNGTVTLVPAGGTYNEGDNVKLRPMPAAGYKFDAWSGDLTSTDYYPEITMNSNKNITAIFSVETNLIKNGDFRQETANWAMKLISPADGGIIVQEGLAYLEVHIDGTTPESVLCEQADVSLINGHNYSLSFETKAEQSRNIRIRFVSETSATTTSFPNQSKAITTTLTNIGHNWTHTAASGAYKLQILLGSAGSNDVWMDNVQLIDNTVSSTVTPKSKKKINIYPNPTKGFVRFSEAVDADFYNSAGQKVQSVKNSSQADISSLPVGIYQVKMNNNLYYKLSLK